MNTTTVNATEYRDLPLAMLTESTTNTGRTRAGRHARVMQVRR